MGFLRAFQFHCSINWIWWIGFGSCSHCCSPADSTGLIHELFLQCPCSAGWMWAAADQHLCQLRSILLFHFPCSFSNVEISSICQAVTSFVIPLCIWLFLFHRNPVISRLSEGNGCADTENSLAWPLPCFVFVNTSDIQAVWDKLLLADCGHWNSG